MRVEGKQCRHINVDKITRCRRLTHHYSELCATHLARRIAEDIERSVTALESEAKMRNITREQLVAMKMEEQE